MTNFMQMKHVIYFLKIISISIITKYVMKIIFKLTLTILKVFGLNIESAYCWR